MTETYFVGWDVGGWNCDKNGRSGDAIVILGPDLVIVGRPWRGNLRESINAATTARDWIAALFKMCGAAPVTNASFTLAVDTPLGFPAVFLDLATNGRHASAIGFAPSNPYLYRQTERLLFRNNSGPLSAIKDMIGSQATKGMHALAKFAPTVERCGVWSDRECLRAIEAYPAACRRHSADNAALLALESLGHEDLDDARICALIAALFASDPARFEPPPDDVPIREGWIWVPRAGEIRKMLAPTECSPAVSTVIG